MIFKILSYCLNDENFKLMIVYHIYILSQFYLANVLFGKHFLSNLFLTNNPPQQSILTEKRSCDYHSNTG